MKRKIVAFSLVVGLIAVFAGSCENDSESNRAVVIVSSINENTPFFSDVLEQGDTVLVGGSYYTVDDFITEDYVLVTFYNRPYNDFTTTGPEQPLSDFIVTRYRVEWRLASGAAGPVPPMYEGATNIQVPSNTLVSAAVLLVPFQLKSDTGIFFPYWYSNDEVLAIAHLTFWGHEVGTDREWSLAAELTVNFGDWIIETDKKKQQQQ